MMHIHKLTFAGAFCLASGAAAFCPPAQGQALLAQITLEGGSGYLTQSQLDALLHEAMASCPATVEGLTALAEAINAAYDSAGARLAFARPTALEGANGTIELVEITYGQVSIAPTADTDPDYILRRAGIRAGDLADLEQLETKLAVFPETDDIRVLAELDPGAQEGTTNLTLTVEEPEPWLYSASLSNDGAPEVGEWRTGVSVTRTSLTGQRDPLTFGARLGEGARSFNIAYSRAVSDAGTRVSGALSAERNRFVNAAAPIDDLVNETLTLSLGLSHPLRAGDDGNDFLEAGLSITRERADILGVAITEQDLTELTLGSNHVRRVPGASITALSHRVGIATLEDGIVGADDEILRWSGTALHARLLNEDWSLTGQFSWQLSNGPVAAAQRFSVAGPQAVRGYPSSESGSDAGYSLRVELSRSFELADGPDLSGFLFADAGRSWSRITGAGATASDPLYSAGLGVTLGLPIGGDGAMLDLRLTAAIPLRETQTFTDDGDVELLFDAGIRF